MQSLVTPEIEEAFCYNFREKLGKNAYQFFSRAVFFRGLFVKPHPIATAEALGGRGPRHGNGKSVEFVS